MLDFFKDPQYPKPTRPQIKEAFHDFARKYNRNPLRTPSTYGAEIICASRVIHNILKALKEAGAKNPAALFAFVWECGARCEDCGDMWGNAHVYLNSEKYVPEIYLTIWSCGDDWGGYIINAHNGSHVADSMDIGV